MAALETIIKMIDSPTKEDVSLINDALIFAEHFHAEHKRLSGEPYLNHLTETAQILAEYGMGAKTIAAGILHDCLEDTPATDTEIKEKFGEEILFMVEGVTKLGKLRYHGTDRHNESLRKLFVAMSEDIRVLMIKLADRLHNMRTLSHVKDEKKKRIAEETLKIYAPIAYRLGMRKMSRELEDLAFPYVFPKEYSQTREIAKTKRTLQEKALEKFLRSVQKTLAKDGGIKARTEYRVKGLYSLYKKLRSKERSIENVYDILALRVIVNTTNECYSALGIIHSTWRPLPGRIKDYIAFPKPNGYKALHTTVFTGDGSIVEIQIKTEEMQRESEYGIASHISYKEGKLSGNIPQSLSWVGKLLPARSGANNTDNNFSKHLNDVPHWIRELVEHHIAESDHEKFKAGLENDFFGQRIFVFTPIGDVVDLPKGSTPVDFAYSIHSEIGNHMVGAKVNGKLVSLDTVLSNGDIIEIQTKANAKPRAKWLDYAKTSIAKRRIRASTK